MNKIVFRIKNMPIRLKHFILLVGVLLLLIVSPFFVYAARVYYIKTFGINLIPTKDYPVKVSEYYLQNDPRWKDDTIGITSQKLGSVGCLISSVSTAISFMDIPINPQEFNRRLSDIDGFQGANLIWYKIKESIPEVDYRYSRTFSRKTIENDLRNGLFPIVNVKYKKTGITHWVLIVGAKDGEFLINDPLGDGKSTMLLSEHGKVYAYRVIEKRY